MEASPQPPAPDPKPDPTAEPGAEAAAPPLGRGALVRLNRTLTYLKSADPRPMLRPPDLVDPGEVGQVLSIRSGQQLAVRFRRGSFLLEAADLVRVSAPDVSDPG
ncbi:MAG: DUF3148 domain-containing protein [Prochlorococcaceae cyanobacterium]